MPERRICLRQSPRPRPKSPPRGRPERGDAAAEQALSKRNDRTVLAARQMTHLEIPVRLIAPSRKAISRANVRPTAARRTRPRTPQTVPSAAVAPSGSGWWRNHRLTFETVSDASPEKPCRELPPVRFGGRSTSRGKAPIACVPRDRPSSDGRATETCLPVGFLDGFAVVAQCDSRRGPPSNGRSGKGSAPPLRARSVIAAPFRADNNGATVSRRVISCPERANHRAAGSRERASGPIRHIAQSRSRNLARAPIG